MGFDFLKPARSGRTVVEAAGLDVKAGDKELLDGVDFALERAEHVALVGPNGSGKTTLLETMLGRRDAAARARRRNRVLLAAGAGAGRARDRARLRPGLDGAAAPIGAEPPRSLPLLRLGRAVEAGDSYLWR